MTEEIKKHVLKTDENSNIFFDEILVPKDSINDRFFNSIFNYSVHKQISFVLSEDAPISYIFNRIEEETKDDSDFMIKYYKNKEDYEKIVSELEKLKKEDKTEADE
jgi:hypothetical protein